jgi:hypothetical protein
MAIAVVETGRFPFEFSDLPGAIIALAGKHLLATL